MKAPPRLLAFRLALQRSETWGPLAMAVAVGLVAGGGAIVLRWMIRAVQWLFFDQGTSLQSAYGIPVPPWLVTVAAPAVGMIVVVYLLHWWAEEARGHGVAEVQFAVRMRGGKIRPRVAVAKAVSSAISIGSGGSVGREGPIVQIGASLGSAVAQFAGLSSEQVKLMVAAGSAGAIAATFNAPVAGVLFGLEVILGSFAARSFGLVVVSSVSATAVAQAVLGPEPAFHLVEPFTFVSWWELGLYLVLGVATGLISLLYVRTVYGVEDWFDHWSAPLWGKALSGGLAVGLLGTLGSGLLFGVGHEGVEMALAGGLSAGLMLALVFMKMAATSITLGAGGSGGVFAPALFIGAMAGGAFGKAAGALLPAVTAPSGAYALVGAAAVFGASFHAPMTAIIILFEMTDDYRIILPLMLAVVVAQLLASRIDPDSINSIKLRRRGGLAAPRTETSTLDILLVADAMTEEVPSVRSDTTLNALAAQARRDRNHSWVVLDHEERMAGIVSLTDLEQAIVERDMAGRTVADIMTRAVVTCSPEEPLRHAFRRFTERDVFQIPVLDPQEGGKLAGVLRRTEMMWAYKELSEEHQRLVERSGAFPTESRFESVHMELQVTPAHKGVCDRAVRDIRVPAHALIALLRRGDRVVVPRGFTRVESGDVLTLLTTRQHEAELREWIAGTGRE